MSMTIGGSYSRVDTKKMTKVRTGEFVVVSAKKSQPIKFKKALPVSAVKGTRVVKVKRVRESESS